jgi:methyl-accepting chemotaxis protein
MKLKVASFKNWGIMWKIMSISLATMVLVACGIFLLLVPKIEKELIHEKSAGIQNLIDVAYTLVTEYEKRIESGELELEDAKIRAMKRVGSMRYEDNNYFWINDLEPRMVMHPINSELNGKDLTENRDPNGKQLFIEAVRVAQSSEAGGTVAYMWAKPGFTKPQPKISYVRLYKPWGWVIGSGIYIDDVETELAAIRSGILYGTFGAMLLALGLAFVVSRIITRPVKQAVAAANQLAIGDLSATLSANSSDEVGQLTGALSNMISGLKAKEHAAQQIANGNLRVEVNPASDLDSLGKAMVAMRDNLKKGKDEVEAALRDAQLKVSYLDNLSFPVLVMDKEMNVVYLNPTAASVTGLSVGDCKGRKCHDLLKNPHCLTDNCATAKSMQMNRTFTAETAIERNGQTIHLQYTGTPIKDASGNIVGAMEQAFDISTIKNVVNEINRTADMLKDGNMDKRAEAGKAEGDYKKLVDGFNATIDNIMKPVNEVVGCLKQMAQGDLTSQVSGDYRGDHGVMKDAMNSTLASLNDILTQGKVAAEQVTTGANQVSDSSQSLSEGATKQASSLQEVTASMNEIGAQTKQNAENASQANQLAGAARNNAEAGNTQMQQMLSAINEMNKSSQQISKIIKSIDEIAFQTNLLALNAAVEAARAGVHGKGFAVVAEEVRNLAQRSAKAAKETSELIENSVKSVENGTRIAESTAKALEQIVGGITKAADLVGEIASASKEQSQGVDQVNSGLGQIDQVTQSNTANAEESAAAAEELSSQAQQLQDTLKRFRLRDNSHSLRREFADEPKVTVVKKTPHAVSDGWGASPKRAKGNGRSAAIALDDTEFGKF